MADVVSALRAPSEPWRPRRVAWVLPERDEAGRPRSWPLAGNAASARTLALTASSIS